MKAEGNVNRYSPWATFCQVIFPPSSPHQTPLPSPCIEVPQDCIFRYPLQIPEPFVNVVCALTCGILLFSASVQKTNSIHSGELNIKP